MSSLPAVQPRRCLQCRYLTGTLHQQTLLAPPRVSLSLGQTLSEATTGFISRSRTAISASTLTGISVQDRLLLYRPVGRFAPCRTAQCRPLCTDSRCHPGSEGRFRSDARSDNRPGDIPHRRGPEHRHCRSQAEGRPRVQPWRWAWFLCRCRSQDHKARSGGCGRSGGDWSCHASEVSSWTPTGHS